ncbi:MAG: hypothetical protein K2X74_00110 [Acetobacteraceae bacterium]|nr:hypothetical protein [Acetobacteraceae bacterium]
MHAVPTAPAAITPWLPAGWSLLGSAGPCHLLAHAEHGAILLDTAPLPTPGAELTLGRTLAAAGLGGSAAGQPPIWYVHLEPERLPRFATLLRDALAARAGPRSEPRGAWMAALRSALRADASWTVPGLTRRAASARGTWRLGLAGLALGLIFAAGLMVGRILSEPRHMALGPPLERADAMTALASGSAAVGPSETSGRAAAALTGPDVAGGASQAPPAAEGPAALASVALPGAVSGGTVAIPDGARQASGVAHPQPASGTAEADAAAPPNVREAGPTATSDIAAPVPASSLAIAAPAPAALPDIAAANPAATPTIAPVAARPPARPPAPRYDRRCSDAQFRWQQGERLSWAEMAYIRQGCATGAR